MITMAVDATRIWIFRFLTLWVCANVLGMGVESVWYAVVVSNATSALILYILYWTGIWKKSTIKIEKTQDEGNNSDEKVKSLQIYRQLINQITSKYCAPYKCSRSQPDCSGFGNFLLIKMAA